MTKHCEHCGVAYTPSTRATGNSKFCSSKCRMDAFKAREAQETISTYIASIGRKGGIVKARVEKIRKMLRELYTDEDVERWLDAPQKLLNDQVPRQMIEAGQHERIEQMLQALLDGAYI